MLPQISPSPLTSLKEPIGHPNWIYELKHDGFRGMLYVDREQARLVSRKGKKFRQFDPLLNQVLRSLKGQRAILDGEIVVAQPQIIGHNMRRLRPVVPAASFERPYRKRPDTSLRRSASPFDAGALPIRF